MRNNKNQSVIYAIAVVWMFVLGKFVWGYYEIATVSKEGALENVCVAVDSILQEQQVTNSFYTVKLVAKSTSKTKEEQVQFLYDVAQQKMALKEETRNNGTSLSWELQEYNLFCCAQYLDMEEDYVVITAQCAEHLVAFSYMMYLQEVVEQYNLIGIPSLEWIAYLPKKLSFMEKNIIVEKILHLFGAQEVEGMRGSDLYSIYGYSPMIPFYIKVEEEKINMNLSFSFLEDTNQTKFQLGIPIL